MMTGASAHEVALDIAQLRVGISKQQGPQQRMIQSAGLVKPQRQQLPRLAPQLGQKARRACFQDGDIAGIDSAEPGQDALATIVVGPVELRPSRLSGCDSGLFLGGHVTPDASREPDQVWQTASQSAAVTSRQRPPSYATENLPKRRKT